MLLTHRLALPLWLLTGGLVPLLFALGSQYLGGLHPCHFCLLQRYPYVLVAACGLLTLGTRPQGLPRRALIAVALMGWLATALLAAIHSGIERHWLAYSGGCVTSAAADRSIEGLLAQISGAPLVACNDVAASFLSLSMAEWNILAALAAMGITLWLYHRTPREAA